jgi:hypothetical protein
MLQFPFRASSRGERKRTFTKERETMTRNEHEGIGTTAGPDTEERQEVDEERATAEYEPNGGDDLVPPAGPDRPADGELGAGD